MKLNHFVLKARQPSTLKLAIGSLVFVLLLMACDFGTFCMTKGSIEFKGNYLVPSSGTANKFDQQKIQFAGGWGKNGQGLAVMSEYNLSLYTPFLTLLHATPGPDDKAIDPNTGDFTHEAYYDYLWQWTPVVASSPGGTAKMLSTYCYLHYDDTKLLNASGGNLQDRLYYTTVIMEKTMAYKNVDGISTLTSYFNVKLNIRLDNSNYNCIVVEFEGFEGDGILTTGFDKS